MGLPSRGDVRSIDTTVADLPMRLTALLGDSRVYLSRRGAASPRAGEVDRIDNGTIQAPRLQIFDNTLIPGLHEASDAVTMAAVAFYRQHHPEHYMTEGTR